jgi:Zn ribbon nucleic-acid-binding protein
MSYRSTARGLSDPEMITRLIERNSLTLLGKSDGIFGGNCPFCGHERSFTIWADKGLFRCFWCGADGRFVPSPEREAERRKEKRAKLATMVA